MSEVLAHALRVWLTYKSNTSYQRTVLKLIWNGKSPANERWEQEHERATKFRINLIERRKNRGASCRFASHLRYRYTDSRRATLPIPDTRDTPLHTQTNPSRTVLPPPRSITVSPDPGPFHPDLLQERPELGEELRPVLLRLLPHHLLQEPDDLLRQYAADLAE